jgi:DNA-damage-inducible protein J
MPENAVVRARIDERIKNEAAAVLGAMGLTVSDAFRLMMVRIAKEKALPFEPLVPNAETIEAMKAARRGELVTVGSPEELLASLNEDDQVHQSFQARLQARKGRTTRQDAR